MVLRKLTYKESTGALHCLAVLNFLKSNHWGWLGVVGSEGSQASPCPQRRQTPASHSRMLLLLPGKPGPAYVQECPLGFPVETFSSPWPQKKPSSGFPDLQLVPQPHPWTFSWHYISEPLTSVLGLLRRSDQLERANSSKATTSALTEYLFIILKPKKNSSLPSTYQLFCCWREVGDMEIYIPISFKWPKNLAKDMLLSPFYRWKV